MQASRSQSLPFVFVPDNDSGDRRALAEMVQEELEPLSGLSSDTAKRGGVVANDTHENEADALEHWIASHRSSLPCDRAVL